MYLGVRITPIIVMVIVVVGVVGGVLAYNYTASQKPLTITSTVTKTTTLTKYSTVYSTITVPAGNETVATTRTVTTTVTVPVTITETVTVTTLPPQPPKTTTTPQTSTKGENFTVGNVQVLSTTTSLGLVDTGSTRALMLLKVPKNMNIESIMSDLKKLMTNGMQITTNTVNVNVQQTYDPVLVVLSPRGTPCTMYKVIVNDGDASDGKISLTIQKYSTANYCIQVVPKDNLYVGIIALRNLQIGHYVVYVTMDYGANKVQYTIDLNYG